MPLLAHNIEHELRKKTTREILVHRQCNRHFFSLQMVELYTLACEININKITQPVVTWNPQNVNRSVCNECVSFFVVVCYSFLFMCAFVYECAFQYGNTVAMNFNGDYGNLKQLLRNKITMFFFISLFNQQSFFFVFQSDY